MCNRNHQPSLVLKKIYSELSEISGMHFTFLQRQRAKLAHRRAADARAGGNIRLACQKPIQARARVRTRPGKETQPDFRMIPI